MTNISDKQNMKDINTIDNISNSFTSEAAIRYVSRCRYFLITYRRYPHENFNKPLTTRKIYITDFDTPYNAYIFASCDYALRCADQTVSVYRQCRLPSYNQCYLRNFPRLIVSGGVHSECGYTDTKVWELYKEVKEKMDGNMKNREIRSRNKRRNNNLNNNIDGIKWSCNVANTAKDIAYSQIIGDIKSYTHTHTHTHTHTNINENNINFNNKINTFIHPQNTHAHLQNTHTHIQNTHTHIQNTHTLTQIPSQFFLFKDFINLFPLTHTHTHTHTHTRTYKLYPIRNFQTNGCETYTNSTPPYYNTHTHTHTIFFKIP
eukprot:GHVR01083306.1.p1 GENE.GHVR01083306.1~~GHVR01083306.1.p1  ORF type:complete len:318 (-),score=116.67 GHVR01083306.1:58-1011(-)